jgi:uncharacterized protein
LLIPKTNVGDSKKGDYMLIRLNKFLSSDQISLKIDKNFTIDDEAFLSDTHLHKNINFKGEAFKVDGSILLNGIIKYTFSDQCARCLTHFDNTIETEFKAVLSDCPKENEKDNESDEIQLKITDGCIDPEEDIKQMIYLSMPMKSLCKPDCKGICPNCGVNLNYEECKCKDNLIDPRFEKLKDLLND